MPYMTAKQSPRYHQVTMEDILFGDADPFAKPAKPWRERIDQGATRTWYAEVVPDTWYQKFNVAAAIDRLEKRTDGAFTTTGRSLSETAAGVPSTRRSRSWRWPCGR